MKNNILFYVPYLVIKNKKLVIILLFVIRTNLHGFDWCTVRS